MSGKHVMERDRINWRFEWRCIKNRWRYFTKPMLISYWKGLKK